MSADQPSNVKAVQIVQIKKNGTLDCKYEKIKQILCNDEVKDKKIAIISIAGEYRTGKSFLLNFFHKKLLHYENNSWMDDSDDLSESRVFEWKSGRKGHTDGIWMLEKPVVVKKDNEEIAVFLMDTQGTKDKNSNKNISTSVFSLSTLLSSLQIYNLKEKIDGSDIDDFQLFIEHGKVARPAAATTTSSDKGQQNQATCYQNVCFLIRDFVGDDVNEENPLPFGWEGGSKLFQETFDENERKELDDMFRTWCFLMPHPGKKVHKNKFTKVSEMKSEFVEMLKKFVDDIITANNLDVKKLDGNPVTCNQFSEFVKASFDSFKSGDLPKIQSVFDAHVELTHANAYAETMKFCNEEFSKKIQECEVWLNKEVSIDENLCISKNISELTQKYDEIIAKEDLEKSILEKFDGIKKMGCKDSYRNDLKKELEVMVESRKLSLVKGFCLLIIGKTREKTRIGKLIKQNQDLEKEIENCDRSGLKKISETYCKTLNESLREMINSTVGGLLNTNETNDNATNTKNNTADTATVAEVVGEVIHFCQIVIDCHSLAETAKYYLEKCVKKSADSMSFWGKIAAGSIATSVTAGTLGLFVFPPAALAALVAAEGTTYAGIFTAIVALIKRTAWNNSTIETTKPNEDDASVSEDEVLKWIAQNEEDPVTKLLNESIKKLNLLENKIRVANFFSYYVTK